MFQDRLAALEGAEACVATATGMAAVATLAARAAEERRSPHRRPRRVRHGRAALRPILARLGIATTWVPLTDLDAWKRAVRRETRLLFIETPSNPACEVADIAALADIAHGAAAVLAVDNCMCSPALQRPIEFCADLVVHSATKYLDGQGRVLAGAIAGRADLVSGPLFNFVRTAGPAISPFNAWICLKGMETLRLRMTAQSANALELARWLEAHPAVERVNYPGLDSHPQHALAIAPAIRRRRGALVRREGRARGGVARHRRDEARVHHRQFRRREDDHLPSRDDDARAHSSRGARRFRHRRRVGAPRRRSRGSFRR